MTLQHKIINDDQMVRLMNVFDFSEPIADIHILEILDTNVTTIEVKYESGMSETIYPNKETLDFILNGIELKRNA